MYFFLEDCNFKDLGHLNSSRSRLNLKACALKVKDCISPQFTPPKMQKIHHLIPMGDSLIMVDKLDNQCAKYTEK
jgi:hypothetical protein